MLKANITSIQHFNVHDGPGIRTVVFFQGCPLKCKWCQNPETISANPRMMYNPDLCIGCKACAEACPVGALKISGGAFVYDSRMCRLCRKCEEECYTKARVISSKSMTLDEVYKEVMKDEVVYKRSGGGITISGGEPLLYTDFNLELFKRLKSQGVGTAVETAGNVPQESLDRIAKYVDTFLFDLKLFHKDKHEKWTGVDNTRIKENLIHVCNIHSNVVIRIPLIPTVNDTDEEFTSMMEFVSRLKHINSVHILPFHNFGANKYSLLGDKYELTHFSEENEERINACIKIAEKFGIKVNRGGTGFAEDKKK